MSNKELLAMLNSMMGLGRGTPIEPLTVPEFNLPTGSARSRSLRRSGPDLSRGRKHNYRALGVTATCAVCGTAKRHHHRNKRRQRH